MKLLLLITLLLAALVSAAKYIPNKYILTFKDDSTPEATVDQVKKAIVSKGGKIGYEYSFIKGFAFSAPDKAIQYLKTTKEYANFPFILEQDQVVSLNDGESA
ncbi:hypothetical protein B0I72DRAFT_133058 [Yarrowia lipolytica]|jgi:hypothetical protein|uniref:YALI0A01452p n=2 Tax=Yarrowia lipolytica TaxID=4952 RepID=B5RSJ5_YARLI|nr:YALI0A01452p [Yarrowia lipolytica CLIB122]AOW00139.1 hypothetical protein YALI1_A01864g [Yarrowia lipolytica]KAB8280928.1 hypothetical protein BKA91DRAFT_141086 [Yarrowia lipolytica]KAE8170207.1 hypothetical protein BKA90DRAFT_141268 [Yarrowia lipolytica]KAJ8051269.1 hypothetical protein LXG23DRAFT_38974 [Yarrowia lipolytica]QNP95667.1 hypothetical protein YALI2_A00666g [Yarrowia lipolytica]|eukprot:XP_002142980.1 YALI0A01452p [Yarrowia lipolytica CLIB122]